MKTLAVEFTAVELSSICPRSGTFLFSVLKPLLRAKIKSLVLSRERFASAGTDKTFDITRVALRKITPRNQ